MISRRLLTHYTYPVQRVRNCAEDRFASGTRQEPYALISHVRIWGQVVTAIPAAIRGVSLKMSPVKATELISMILDSGLTGHFWLYRVAAQVWKHQSLYGNLA